MKSLSLIGGLIYGAAVWKERYRESGKKKLKNEIGHPSGWHFFCLELAPGGYGPGASRALIKNGEGFMDSLPGTE